MLSDGNIDYVGRNDFQVKINGYRIELGEVESRIQNINEIEQVIVVAHKHTSGDSYLCAYYIGKELSEDDIKEIIAEDLAAYMIPDYIVHLDAFPTNVSGKIDRKKTTYTRLF